MERGEGSGMRLISAREDEEEGETSGEWQAGRDPITSPLLAALYHRASLPSIAHPIPLAHHLPRIKKRAGKKER
jgi:hypothetical protein